MIRLSWAATLKGSRARISWGIWMSKTTSAAVAATLGLGLAFAAAMAGAEEAKKAPAPNAVGAGSGWAANVAADKAGGATLDEAQTSVIKTVNTYFNDLKHLKGSFVQTNPDKKRQKGKFALKRPGKFRFDYSLPSKQIIISDGEYLAIQDLDLNNEDRIALDQTPFRLVMRKDVDLLRDAKIIDAQQSEDLVILTVQDKSPDTPGRIKLFLATKPSVELKEWVTTDAQGQETRVEIGDLNRTDDVDAGLFKIEAVGFNKQN